MTRNITVIKLILIGLLFVVLTSAALYAAIPTEERVALIAIFNSTNGDNWTNNSGWKTPPLHTDGFALPGTESNWYGIGISQDYQGRDYVVDINLRYNGLRGPIPPEIRNLYRLEELSLWSNLLTGNILPELGYLGRLKKLDLDNTHLTGGIPPELGNLGNLEELILSVNQFSGNIPPELGKLSNLRLLSLGSNQLSGSIPSQLGNLSNLESLWLGSNQLTGTIPPGLGNLSKLETLFFSFNQLSGSIPPELGNLDNLKTLSLWYNQLSGNIPPELGNLRNLNELLFNNNRLSGSIPAELGNLNNLRRLSLNKNQLTGNIPPELGNLSSLVFLDLNNNQITGIPPELGDLKNLETLYLDYNRISGIPAEIGNLNSLNMLCLNNNQVSSIPAELARLPNLSYLNLNDNQLSGSLPLELKDLRLNYLNLSNNQLSGSIPSWIGQTVSGSLEMSSNRFSGSIPPGLGHLYFLRIDGNKLSGSIPPDLANVKVLYLNSNKLSGSIPESFLSWLKYSERSLDIHYNALYTDNETLANQISIFCYGWENTQTVAPTHLSAAAASLSSITVSWDPVLYTGDPGCYLVYRSTSPGSPWIYAEKTVDKSANSYTVTGLNSGIKYYFVVKTQTDSHSSNSNIVISESSAVVSATTGSAAVTFTLTVQSSPYAGITIPVSPNDNSNNGDGITNFTRTYNEGTTATLTAPSNFNGKEFSKWVVDDEVNTKLSVQITMNSNHTATAYYVSTAPPELALNRNRFNFGATFSGTQTDAQPLLIDNSGGGTLNWTAEPSESWLLVAPSSGTGYGEVSVSVDASGMPAGNYIGAVIVSDPEALNSPQTVHVILNVYQSTAPPFGSFDTPIDGSTMMSSIPVTGWALDDIGVDHVTIYREEGGSLLYIGDAVFVEGARNDIEKAYPDYPNNYKAGWGYMLLTNYLPNQGNGTFILYAKATDKEGNTVTLATKTITCDNANAVKPFGAMDTPEEGGTASGSSFVNFGWALTPQPNTIPTDGSTIRVWVDGVPLGNPVYNQYRADIAAKFPGYNNSNGAVGYFYLDTTKYENGVHTIAWSVKDDAGNQDGIGSRYFTIQNRSVDSGQWAVGSKNSKNGVGDFSRISVDYSEPVEFKKGYNLNKEAEILYPDENGNINIQILELQPLQIHFSSSTLNLSPLPTGSFLDTKRGIFYWQPGAGFIGEYKLAFVKIGSNGEMNKKSITIKIVPKFLSE